VQIQVQQLQYQVDSIDGDIETMTEQKMKNRADLLARQQKTKYYQKVQIGQLFYFSVLTLSIWRQERYLVSKKLATAEVFLCEPSLHDVGVFEFFSFCRFFVCEV